MFDSKAVSPPMRTRKLKNDENRAVNLSDVTPTPLSEPEDEDATEFMISRMSAQSSSCVTPQNGSLA